MAIKVQAAYRISNKWEQEIKPSYHIIIKILDEQNNDTILKAAREQGQVPYKGKPIRIIPDFSTEIIKPRKAWSEVMWTLKNKDILSFAGQWMKLENIILSENMHEFEL